jgi:K+ transporter
VPEVNTIASRLRRLTLMFRVGNLAAAYGIAVMGTMVITTILLFSSNAGSGTGRCGRRSRSAASSWS